MILATRSDLCDLTRLHGDLVAISSRSHAIWSRSGRELAAISATSARFAAIPASHGDLAQQPLCIPSSHRMRRLQLQSCFGQVSCASSRLRGLVTGERPRAIHAISCDLVAISVRSRCDLGAISARSRATSCRFGRHECDRNVTWSGYEAMSVMYKGCNSALGSEVCS